MVGFLVVTLLVVATVVGLAIFWTKSVWDPRLGERLFWRGLSDGKQRRSGDKS